MNERPAGVLQLFSVADCSFLAICRATFYPQGDKQYQADHSSTWTKEIADEVKNKLKELGLPRYKFMVQVVLGEQRGQGVRMGSRSFWDTNTDNSASHTYMNDNLFCVCVAFGVYLY